MADGRVRTIGEVITNLRGEFPEVSVSKVRFLETKGMVKPRRSKSGYREFTSDDVSRIRYILQQQRDHFLPLKVIKSKLNAWERGEVLADAPSGPPPDTYFATTPTEMSREELSRAAGLAAADLELLIENSVIQPASGIGGDEVFGSDDLTVAQSAARLLRNGLEARHLRTLRLGAERSSELLHQLTVPLLRHGNPDTRRRAAEVLADCAQATGELQQAILRSTLAGYLEE
ncbi:MAG: MerR family transcriptional regulator [Acidimicrobiia bacterium]|nr:MerR family transcriptional regulator [Acidimicrobiia bacterium]